MREHSNLMIGMRAIGVAFLLAFGGTSLAADAPSTADPAPNPAEGEVQERSIIPPHQTQSINKRGDLDIISVYGRCRAYSSSTGQTLCGRKVCYVAKNLGPGKSFNFTATVRLGGLDHTTGNYGPQTPLDTFGPLGEGVSTGERCKEFTNEQFLDPFQPIHYVVVELNAALDLNLANNGELKSINYQTCLSQPGNQC